MTRVNWPTIHEQWGYEKLEWYIKDAFNTLYKAYEVIREKKKSKPYSKPPESKKWDLENQITDDLVECAERIPKTLPYVLDRESKNPKTRDRIDITIIHALELQFKHRLGIECKRLDSGLCGKYHSEGICRFITGKYTEIMPIAGMIGYIQGSNLLRLIKNINGLLEPKNTIQALRENPLLGQEKTVYLSRHDREGNLGKINLFHLMLDYRGIIAGSERAL